MCFAPQRRALFRHLNCQVVRARSVFNILTSTCASRHNDGVHLSTSQLPKVVRNPWCALYVLTWKCASRHNSVHFFDIENFQKWSEAEVLCTFWLANVLRATTACNFASLIWPAGSAPAALASLLFDPPEPQIIGKHSVSRLSYLFAHLHLLSSYSFSSALLSSNLSLLSASSLLCFSSLHIVGSLTSKLPWIILFTKRYQELAKIARIYSNQNYTCFSTSHSLETTRNNEKQRETMTRVSLRRGLEPRQKGTAALWELDHHWVVQLLWPEPNSIVRMEILCYLFMVL